MNKAESEIGVAAGAVWQYLSENPSASASRIARGTGLKPSVAQRAIGWLAREGKLDWIDGKRGEEIRLR